MLTAEARAMGLEPPKSGGMLIVIGSGQGVF